MWGIVLRLAVWIWWCPRGRTVLVVTSASPVWDEYMAERVLSIVLKWSQRKHWRPSLATSVFHHFGGCLNFNPMVIVFRPLGRTHVFRYFKAFRDYKHGNAKPIRRLTTDLRLVIRRG